MAFSFFKRNDPKPAPKAPKQEAPAAKEKPRGTPPAEPAKSGAPAKPRQPDRGPSTEEELMSLDFTSISSSPRAVAPPVHVLESSDSVHPVVEEVAMLHANGDDKGALAAVEKAITSGDLGGASELVWGLLFDLYLLAGKREAFEARAIDYAMKFERSAPTWRELASADKASVNGPPALSLSGQLDATAKKQLEQLVRMGLKVPVVRLDVGRLQGVDNVGCALLAQIIQRIRRLRHRITFVNSGQLLKLLEAITKTGKRENREAWLLRLELLQQTGTQEQFENLALDFAITFELSPPSWENLPPAPAAAEAAQAEPERAVLAGEILSAKEADFRPIEQMDTGDDVVAVDCSGLRRIDFVSAGMLANTLNKLRSGGKKVRLIEVNNLVAALFTLLGVGGYAEIVRKKL
ncbi:MAG: STAS domain-containing protein [Rhodocyclaceae bacterium]|nr:STAS domain-containing protein [Rhodocyclaceae bacterium]MBX3670054.1 STAS domain-containing protein [Rhodocyclaceae bacterium]